MAHVWGYTIVNDVSARDLQHAHRQWFLGKSLDRSCPMGPVVVTADEFDWRDLLIETRVNGELDSLLIARCKRRYELILMDTGAVDSKYARWLAPQADLGILIAGLRSTPKEVAREAANELRGLGVRLQGCVLLEPHPA